MRTYNYFLILLLGISINSFGQQSSITWKKVTNETFQANLKTIEKSIQSSQELELPNLDGKHDTFIIKPVHFIAKEVANQYTIQTFQGYKKGNPNIRIAVSYTPNYFSAEILGAKKSYSVESVKNIDNHRQMIEIQLIPHLYSEAINCTLLKKVKAMQNITRIQNKTANVEVGGKRTLRLVMSASKEYSQRYGGTPYSTTNVLNAIASGVNMINVVFKRELGIEFTLVSDHRTIIAPDVADADNPFSGAAVNRAEQNQQFIGQYHGIWTYDLGHHVAWGETGGSAVPTVVCYPGYQSKGASGTSRSTTVLWLDYVVHEIGHQMGAEHNFSSQECGASWDSYRFEPGQGSSIMSYAALCGYGYTNETSPYFHLGSLQKIVSTLTDGVRYTCRDANRIVVGNNLNSPVVSAKSNITIPKQTPFILVGDITDADNDTVSYQWEQFDGNGAAVPGYPDCSKNDNALFRFREPVFEKYRCFPQHSKVLAGNNANVTWEKLPCTARTMNFALLGRDNNIEYGRLGEDKITVTVANTGPFELTAFNNGGNYNGNSNQNVTWSVNGTNTHCPNIDILISTDGGVNYTEIISNIANNGSATIQLPNVNTSNAVLLARCHINQSSTRVKDENRAISLDAFRTASTFYDTGNSTFSIKKVISANPVKFGEFTTQVKNKIEIILKWTTITEANNFGFEIQKQINGVWQKIAFINGKGNSQVTTSYQFTDKNPQQGENLYRLKQIDYDGQFEYSNIAKKYFSTEKQRVSYNQITQTIKINENCNALQLIIYSATGQIVFQEEIKNKHFISLNHLTKGIYIGSLKCKNKNLTFKIVR